MKQLWRLTLNTLKVTFAKKISYLIFLILPVMGMLFSLVIYQNVPSSGKIRVGICNQDQSKLATDLVQALQKKENFKVSLVAVAKIKQVIVNDQTDLVVLIPKGFASQIEQQKPINFELISNKGSAVTRLIKSYLNLYLKNLLDLATAAEGKREVFAELYQGYQQERVQLRMKEIANQSVKQGITYQSIGFLILFMMMGAGLTSQIIIKEKQMRTFYRICAAPVSAKTYLLSNVCTNLLIVTFQICLVLFLMNFVLKVNVGVPMLHLLVILLATGLVAIGFGLATVAFAKDTLQANTVQNIFINSTCMLGGCYFPLSIMPEAARKFADFLPQRWTMDAVQKLQAGGSFAAVLPNLAILLAFALTLFLLAVYQFQNQDDLSNFG